jgi:hypothetical protein
MSMSTRLLLLHVLCCLCTVMLFIMKQQSLYCLSQAYGVRMLIALVTGVYTSFCVAMLVWPVRPVTLVFFMVLCIFLLRTFLYFSCCNLFVQYCLLLNTWMFWDIILAVYICMVLILPTGSFHIWGLIANAVGDMTRVRVPSFEYLAREIRFTDFATLSPPLC